MTIDVATSSAPGSGQGDRPPVRRVPRVLLVLHLLVAVGVFGVDLVLAVLGLRGASGASPESVYPAMDTIATWLLGPLAVLSLGTGLLLTARGRRRLPGDTWVTAKAAVTVLLTTAAVLVLIPSLDSAGEAATRTGLVTDGQTTRAALAPLAAVAFLALNVALAVFKPVRRNHARPR